MKESTRKVIREQIQTLVHGVEVMFGVVAKVFDCGPQDPSEDFAYFAQALPAAFLYIGCAKDDGLEHPHHSPDFFMDERALLIAAQAVGTAALNFLN